MLRGANDSCLAKAAPQGGPADAESSRCRFMGAGALLEHASNVRNLVARMKLIPIAEIIKNKKLLFCEDSIVRGTQLRETIQRLFDYGAKEVHMRPACPPLIHGCKFLNFSRSSSELDLAGRWAIRELKGDEKILLDTFADEASVQYFSMVEQICKRLNLTSLKYQTIQNMLDSIGLPEEDVCTYCWNGVG